MISLKTRLIREHNRLYKLFLRLQWRHYGLDAPIVLMAHGFKPSKNQCKNAFEMTRVSFERLMQTLEDKGWSAMTYEELKGIVLNRQWKPKRFYLTFDDAYETVYTEALPVLERLCIPFTVFITKDLVGKPGFITKEHLQELAKHPLCTVGGHGLQHRVFRDLSTEEMNTEFQVGRKWLEQELGVHVDSFAFPYGRIIEVSHRNRAVIHGQNFDMSFSAIEGSLRSSWFTGRFFLPRVNVSERFVDQFSSGHFPRYKDCEGR